METKRTVVGELKITRAIIQDGVGPAGVQIKVVPEVDAEGALTGPLVSGFSFRVKSEDLIPVGYDGAELILKDEDGNPVNTGRAIFALSGTMTLDLKVEKEEAAPEKKDWAQDEPAPPAPLTFEPDSDRVGLDRLDMQFDKE